MPLLSYIYDRNKHVKYKFEKSLFYARKFLFLIEGGIQTVLQHKYILFYQFYF